MAVEYKIFYEGVDITRRVRCADMRLTDRYGGQGDDIELMFWDPAGTWPGWEPKQGDRLRVWAEGYDTGTQTVNEILYQGNRCTLRSVSSAMALRKEGWNAQNEVTFYELARRCAMETGLELERYGVDRNPSYRRAVRGHETPIAWMVGRCELENIAVKVDNGRLLLIDRDWVLAQEPALKLSLEETKIHGTEDGRDETTQVKLICGGLTAAASHLPDNGRRKVRTDIAFYSQAEGERFARNLLLNLRRQERRMNMSVPFAPGVAALALVRLGEHISAAGDWVVKEVAHCPLEGKSHLTLEGAQMDRAPMRGVISSLDGGARVLAQDREGYITGPLRVPAWLQDSERYPDEVISVGDLVVYEEYVDGGGVVIMKL